MTIEQLNRFSNKLDVIIRRLDSIETRLQWEFPYDHELREQLEAEVSEILGNVDTEGAGIRVFEEQT